MMPPIPKPIRILCIVLCAITALSAVPLAVSAAILPRLVPDQRPALALVGFELVVLVAAVLGILIGRGRYAQAPALALACVGGTILASSALGWKSANRVLAGFSLDPVLAFRALAGLFMLAAAALIVLVRDKRSFKSLAKGLALLAPVALVAAALLYGPTRSAIERALAIHTMVEIAAAVFGFLILAVLVATGGHCIIRAFEFGRLDAPARPANNNTAAPGIAPAAAAKS